MLLVGDRILPGFLFAAQAEGEKGDGEGKFERAEKNQKSCFECFFVFLFPSKKRKNKKNTRNVYLVEYHI